MMAKLEQRTLKHDVCQAEQNLLRIANAYGKDSSEYRNALIRFARLWSVLKMTRSKDEFLPGILNQEKMLS